MGGNDLEVVCSDTFRRLYEFLILYGQDGSPDDSRVARPGRARDGKHSVEDARPKCGYDRDGKKKARYRKEDIHDTHDHVIDLSAVEACDRS